MGQCGRVLGGKNKNGDCLFTMTQCFVRGLKIRIKACKKSKNFKYFGTIYNEL